MQNTISIHVGNTSSIIHNNRKTENHTNPDIDVSRSGDNIVLVQENIKFSYEKLFGQAVDEYNAKQKRVDRKINNYLQKVKDSALDHQKEFILQIGDYQSLEKLAEAQGCKIWETQEWQLRAETLKQAVLNFQVQNPNLYVYNAIIHLDELNPHAHVNFIPVGDNMKKGMNKQVSMNRALENMGYDAKFEVSSEAKNVKERGRIKLNNSENFKNWRDDNLERVKEIAKEVYQKAGQTFDFVEGDKTNQHESVQAYKRTVEAAKEKSREIIKQAEKDAKTAQEELREQAYDLWVDDWKTTKSKFEDFELELNPFNWYFDGFNSALDREQQEKGSIKVDEQTPRRFNFSFSELKELFKVKFKVLTKYINSKWQHLSRREVEIEKTENTLTEKKKGLESKLEDLNNEIEVKQQSLNRMSKALNVEMGKVHATRALINAGDEIIGKLKESESDIKINKPLFSEKTVTMPYAKYEKMRIANWQNPFRSAYVEFEKNSSELVERMANREGILQEKVSNLRKENSTLSKEKSSLFREKSQYQSDYIALNNTVIALVNEDKLSIKDLERHVETLPQTFITDYDIPVPEKEAPKPRRTHNLDKGFGLSL